MDAKHSPAVIGARVDNLENQYTEQRSDIKELRNIVLVLAIAGVAAIGGLYVQIGSLSKDISAMEARLSATIMGAETGQKAAVTSLSHQQELIRKDIKSIEDKLDTLINKK